MKNKFLLFFLILTGTVFSFYHPITAFSQEQNSPLPAVQDTSVPDQTDEPLFDQQEALNHYKEGIKSYQKRKYRNAISELEKAIDINPDYKEAYYLLGYSYYKEGQMDPSRDAFNQAYELDRRYSPAGRYSPVAPK